jgi:hypothetical protein
VAASWEKEIAQLTLPEARVQEEEFLAKAQRAPRKKRRNHE